MNRLVTVGTLFLALFGLAANDQAPEWHAATSHTGTVKSRDLMVRFKVSSANWRLHLTTSPAEDAYSPSARVALMQETLRDINGTPVNWRQVDVLSENQASDDVSREYDNGLTNDGQPQWFALSISGHGVKYKLDVEEPGPAPAKKKRNN